MIAKLSIDQAYSDDAKRTGHHHIIDIFNLLQAGC
jgi:dynactin complex subunit